MSLKGQVFAGVKWTTFSTIILAISGILKLSILTRYLDKSDFGLMALVMFVLGFTNLFMDMGLSSAILHKQDISKSEYSSLFWLNLLFSILLYITIIMLAPIISLFYKEPELKILIPLMGLSLMISAIGRQYQTIEQKNLNFKLIAVINIFSIILSIGIAILLAIFGFGVYSLVYSALTQYFFSNIIFFIAGIRKRKLIFHFDYKETKPYLKIGLYQVGGQIVNYFNRDFDILIIGKYFGIEILGGYNLAKQLVFRPTQILNPIVTNIASPILPKYQNNIKQLKENYLKIVKLVASINFPIYLIIIIFAGYLVNILYGDQYQNITGIVRVLSVYMFLRAIGNPVGALFIATGKTQYDLSWNLFLLMIFPLIILIGCQFSIMMVASLMTISMLLFSYPFWYFIIRPLVGANFIEYVNSLIPSIFMLINAIKNRNQA